MGILDSLSFFIIAAILSFVIADHVPNPFLQREPAAHSEALGFVNTTWADIENFDLELCARNGGPVAYDIQKGAFSNFSACMMTVYMEVAMEASLVTGTSLSDYTNIDFDKIHCRYLSSYDNCVQDLTQKIRICLDPEKHETTHIIYSSWEQVTRFLCKDDGAAMTTLNGLKSDACLRSKSESISRCANQTIIKYLHATVPDGAAVGRVATIHLFEPNAVKCNVFQTFQNCAVEELKTCPDQTSAGFTDVIFNIVKEVANCNRWLKSEATSYSVVNVLLITILTTIMSVRLF